MNDILLYSLEPVLATGLGVALADYPRFKLAGVSTTIQELVEQIRAIPGSLILMDFTPDVTVDILTKIHSEPAAGPIILWVDDVSTEFAYQVLGLGVRGILRKRLSIELALKSFQMVADGELGIEKDLTDRLLTNRVAFTPRERQLLGVVIQGLKNKEIASMLGITEGTVKVYFSRLFAKVGVTDRFDLARFALRNASTAEQIEPVSRLDEGPRTTTLYVPGFVSRPAA